jgi:hypothetical protein
MALQNGQAVASAVEFVELAYRKHVNVVLDRDR